MASQQRTFATPDNPIVQRVSQDLRGDYKKNFVRGGTVYFEHFPAYTVRYPTIDASQYPARFVEYVAGNLTDRYAKDTLEKEFRCLNWLRECTHLIPLYTTGDGNCLLHAASLAMWGFEDKGFILRNAVYESLTTADRNTNTLQDRCRMSISSMLRDVQVNMSDNDWFSEWQQMVNQARPDSSGYHQSLEESHIFVLANVLRRPIIVYGVPKARSFNTGGTMQNINFHGIYLPLLWGSQLCHKPPLCLGYGMGHFTALVPAGNPQQQLTVPLTDNTGHVLPIRFLLQAEEQNTFYLLEQYIDVIKLYSASMSRQIPAAVIGLREATHVGHLVHGYIDMCLTEFNKQNQPYYAQSQPAAAPQGEIQRHQCVGCNSAYGSAETNFLCSICYKKHTSAAAGYNPSQSLKCRSSGCQQQGLTSKDGYCNECYVKSCNPSADQFQWNDLDAKAGNPRVPDVRNPPAPMPSGEPGERQKCYKCKDFYANEEYHGLCSGCFKKLTIEESQQKPQFSQPKHVQAQPTPIQANNNAEPVPEKCKACKEFHGDVQFGGLCSVCFKKKSKEESAAKPPQQSFNDLRQNPKQEQIYHPQQASPAHQQQPVYNQGRVNPPPQQQPNVFGFNECMSRGCARPADEQCQGYCVQCFGKSVERLQQSQQNQWQQDQQQRQQEEQARRQREFQEAERQRLEQERMRRQQEDNNRMEQQRQQEMMKQKAIANAPQRNDFVPQAQQQQQTQHQVQHPKPQETSFAPQQPRHAATAPITTGELCFNSSCGDFAVPNCDGYCAACFSSRNQPPDAATSHNHVNSIQRPPIKPRKNLPKTDLISTVPKPLNKSVETMSIGGRSQSFSASEIKCFVCAKRKPTTGDLLYNLCPAHAQRVAAMSLDYDTPPVSQQPETSYTNQQTSTNYDQQRRGSTDYLQPAGPAQHRAEQIMTPHSGEQLSTRYSGEQQRRGSTDYLQSAGPVQHRAEQIMTPHSGEQHPTRYSGEQHQTGRVANHYSGEQGNRSHLTGPQTNPPNQPPHQTHTTHHTGEQIRREQYIQPQEPRSHTTELPFGGGTQSRYPPNSKHYGQSSAGGQPSYQQNNPAGYPPMSHQNAAYDDYNQGSYRSQGSHATGRSSSQGDVNQRIGYHMGQQYSSGHGDQRSFQPGQNPNYGDQQNRQGGSEIKYPPRLDPSMSYGSQDYPSNDLRYPSSQFNSHPPSQYSGAGGGSSANNDQYNPQSYQQQQHHQQQPGGGNQEYGRPGNFGGADQYPRQPGGGNQGHGGGAGNYGMAGNHGGAGAAANYPPQGAGSQHLPGQKPPISSHADPHATHPYNDDMPRAKVLCRYPGCSFYAIPERENYCQDCYENKSGLKNYQRCQTPTCPNLVAASGATKLCESCLMSSAKRH